MFGIGVTEMIVIGLVILMLFSPRELPGMIKTLARAYGSIRRTAEEFRSQVMDAEELREPIEEIRAAYHGTKTELLSAQDMARRELGRARAEAMKAQQKLSQLAREESRRETAALHGRVSTSEPPDAPTTAASAAVLSTANAAPNISSAPVPNTVNAAAPNTSSAAVPAPPSVPTPAPPPPVTASAATTPATDRSDAA